MREGSKQLPVGINGRISWTASLFSPKFVAKERSAAPAAGRKERPIVSRVRQVTFCAIGLAVMAGAGPVLAQSNLDAGKSPAQIFADTCNACHRTPREIKPAGARFLLQHYTTSGREAAAMAGYLAAIGSDPRAVQQRRPPTMGAGRAPIGETTNRQTEAGSHGVDSSRSPSTAAGKFRRPSDSIDGGSASAAIDQASATASSAVTHNAVDAFEE